MKRKILNISITLVIGFIIFYFTIPAIDIHNPGFYAFLISILVIYGALSFGGEVVETVKNRKFSFRPNAILAVPIIVVSIIIINFISSPIFHSRAYSERIIIDETGDFSNDIAEVDFRKTPLLDKDSSAKLGDRVMGEMKDFVSQYYVSDLYTQINYRDDIVRVTPLEYADSIKYLNNRKDGIKGYVMVNSVTGLANVIKLDEGMKYVPSAIFNEDMMRHLRFKYPTLVFGDYTFEIDDEGNPYFIIPIIKYYSVGLRTEITGVIALDPITGDTKKYDVGEVPEWIDHVYSADLIIEETDDWGMYKDGFWNSIFTQKNVTNTTDGYNYLAMDGDIYLYTGITSVVSDESNLGFILSNLRTKKTIFYSVPGAEEYSAMASAEGQVQEMNYISTFPLLINLNGRATYLISLKDAAGLVKKYAFVDVQDYQKVSTTDASLGIEVAKDAYLKQYRLDAGYSDLQEKNIIVKSVKSAIIEGNTFYYIIDENGSRYSVSINVNEAILPFVEVGTTLKIKYIEDEVKIVKSVEEIS